MERRRLQVQSSREFVALNLKCKCGNDVDFRLSCPNLPNPNGMLMSGDCMRDGDEKGTKENINHRAEIVPLLSSLELIFHGYLFVGNYLRIFS